MAIILIIAAIAIPNLLRAQIAANQASAVGSLRTISSAEETFSSTFRDGYTLTLAQLGGPAGSNGCKNAGFIDEVLSTAPNQKSGYTFTFTSNGYPPDLPPGFNAYLTTAVPVVVGQTGQTSYCSEEPGIIHYDSTGAQAASPAACTALPSLQ